MISDLPYLASKNHCYRFSINDAKRYCLTTRQQDDLLDQSPPPISYCDSYIHHSVFAQLRGGVCWGGAFCGEVGDSSEIWLTWGIIFLLARNIFSLNSLACTLRDILDVSSVRTTLWKFLPSLVDTLYRNDELLRISVREDWDPSRLGQLWQLLYSCENPTSHFIFTHTSNALTRVRYEHYNILPTKLSKSTLSPLISATSRAVTTLGAC